MRLTGTVQSSTERGEPSWTARQLEEIYDRWSTADNRIVWVIIDNSAGTVVGESVLEYELDQSQPDAATSASGSPVHAITALGTEATQPTMRHAFEEQGLNRVELQVYDFNPRARHVYQKVGFVTEGTKRQALLFDGAWVNAHDMAILAQESNQHREAQPRDTLRGRARFLRR